MIWWVARHSWTSRTPPGVRELKLYDLTRPGARISRTPPGVRELKLEVVRRRVAILLSHPSRGA